MSGELTIFKNGAVPSTAFDNDVLPKSRLGDGVAGSPFARVSYRASHWSIKNQGKTEPLQRMIDGRLEENPNLDIVILKAANHPTKAWYKDAYNPNTDSFGPDCFSSNGLKPDPDVRLKQSEICLNCPNSKWGSKVRRDTGEFTRGKDCADHKKLVVVPVGDIENKIYGGPMLLQVPPSSLKRLAPYQNMLEANTFHYAQVHTRITFEQGADISYPLFKFDALAALDDVQAEQVMRMLKHPLVDQILLAAVQESDEEWSSSAGERAQPSASIHILKAPASAASPADVQATQASQAQAAPAPQLTPAQQEIAALKAQLAQAQKLAAEPELTPEQKEIAALKAQLATVSAGAKEPAKRGRPRTTTAAAATARTPQVAPTNMDSAPAGDDGVQGPSAGLPGPGNPAADDAIARINQTLNKARNLI